MRTRILATLLLAAGFSQMCEAQAKVLAPTPPMGWNSWDAYGLTITEAQFRENVDVLARVLKPFGWNYAVIDEGWFLRNPQDRSEPAKLAYEIDGNGRYIPVPARFPSALQGGKNTGFAALGASVHAQGLQFGIHIVRGIPREAVKQNLPIAGSRFNAEEAADKNDVCPWDPTNWGVRDTPAGQAWYDALLTQYAGWGVDYLKVDCIADHPYKPAEILMLHRAIVKSGRAIVLSLSPGPTSPGVAKEVMANAQMWRISDDVWDWWATPGHFPRGVKDQFELLAGWAPYAHAGAWPDADMLPFGYLGPMPGDGVARASRLTHDEQRTMLSLWAMARSPLVLGANLTRLDDWTKTLLTNREVLEVDQKSHDGRQVTGQGDAVVWTASGDAGVRYLALFNVNDRETTVTQTYDFYNLPAKAYRSRELWSQVDGAAGQGVRVTLAPHTCVLYKLRPEAAVSGR